MKWLGILLIAAGLVAFAMPAIVFLRKGKPPETSTREAMLNKADPVSFAPMLGVMFLSVGGALLVAGAITNKK
jgi:uncharacterized membrane protein HdeD (DUF308 family)